MNNSNGPRKKFPNNYNILGKASVPKAQPYVQRFTHGMRVDLEPQRIKTELPIDGRLLQFLDPLSHPFLCSTYPR
jgi:hypothetical protein